MIPPKGTSGVVDLHSHLVPGVDDGARTVQDVLEGIGRMVERRVSHVVTTPHLDGTLTLLTDRFAERMEEMDKAFTRARRAVKETFPDVTFQRANEVALDHPEPDLTDPRLQLNGAGYVLVEWPRLSVPPSSGRVLERLEEQGIRLLLAHPERYRLGERHMELMESWKEAGACLQVNYGSLAGAYGPDARRRSLELLSRGWVDCLATDFHGRAGLRLFMEAAREHFPVPDPEGESESEVWNLLTRANPRRILDGVAPAPVPPLERGEGFWTRLASRFR